MTRMIILALLLQLAFSTNDAVFTESTDNMDTVQMNMNGAGRDDHDHDHAEAHSGNHSEMSAIHSTPRLRLYIQLQACRGRTSCLQEIDELEQRKCAEKKRYLARQLCLQRLRRLQQRLRRPTPSPTQSTPLRSCSWVTTAAVSSSCPTSCGNSATTLYGTVECNNAYSGMRRVGTTWKWVQTKNSCTGWDCVDPEPTKPSLTCAKTKDCYQWVEEEPESCKTQCRTGVDQKAYQSGGAIGCIKKLSGEVANDGDCAANRPHLNKPPGNFIECPSIPMCVEWYAAKASTNCGKTYCDKPAKTNYGDIKCRKVKSSYWNNDEVVANSECALRSKNTKPAKLSYSCAKGCNCAPDQVNYPGECCTAQLQCCTPTSVFSPNANCKKCCTNNWKYKFGCPWSSHCTR